MKLANGDDKWSGTIVFSIVLEAVRLESMQSREMAIDEATKAVTEKVHRMCREYSFNFETIDVVRTEGD